MQNLERIPSEIKNKIISKYGSLEEFYFEIWYNRHQHYHAFKDKRNDIVTKLDNALYDFEDELEEFGIPDGSEITGPIYDDYGEMIAINYVNKTLSEIGFDKEAIKDFINRYLGKKK